MASGLSRRRLMQMAGAVALSDIVNDPDELRNRAGDVKYAAVLDELRKTLADWSRRTGYRIPETRTLDEFDRETGAPLPNRIRPRPSKKESQKDTGSGGKP